VKYGIQYIDRHPREGLSQINPRWDLLVSAYNASDRVRNVFTDVPAADRLWVVHEEYDFEPPEIPSGDQFRAARNSRESAVIRGLFEHIGLESRTKICIDTTGFMRHTLLALLFYAVEAGLERFWLLYSDPATYTSNERTVFSKGISEVRQVDGYQGLHVDRTEDDTLVLGTGYDLDMMRAAIERKWNASRIDVFGLPSLQPSMYQENVLSVARLDAPSDTTSMAKAIFAPANDPFATADALRNGLADRLANETPQNIYLSPTGTKAQVAGFGLFFLGECRDKAVSILMPIPDTYEGRTSEGHARTWVYEVDTRLFHA
jgi:hypothetical protein